MEFGPEALVFDAQGNPTYPPLSGEPIDEQGRPVRGPRELRCDVRPETMRWLLRQTLRKNAPLGYVIDQLVAKEHK